MAKRMSPRAASAVKAAKQKAKTKIQKDPVAEYRSHISDGVSRALLLADDDCASKVRQFISTQSLALDELLRAPDGRRGIACGRVTEIFGPAHIGKSTLLDHLFAEVQRVGGVAVLFDVEGARDEHYTKALGVDVGALNVIEFGKGQKSMENILTKIDSTIEFWTNNYPETPVVVGWDSLGMTSTQEELENAMGDKTVGSAAKLIRKYSRSGRSGLSASKVALVVLNHEYQKINTGGFSRPGVKRETYGGEGLRSLASTRLELYPAGYVKRSDGVVLGREVGAKVVKNRFGPSPAETRFALLNGTGINNVWSIYERFRRAKLIQVSGAWATLNLDGELMKFQGWAGLAEKCLADTTLFGKLADIFQKLSEGQDPASGETIDPETGEVLEG